MNAVRTLRKIAAFCWRDFLIARGYRLALIAQTVEELFGVATFFYLSRFVDSPQLQRALPAGRSYFTFALVGFARFDYRLRFQPGGSAAKPHAGGAAGHPNAASGNYRGFGCLSVRGARAAHVR